MSDEEAAQKSSVEESVRVSIEGSPDRNQEQKIQRFRRNLDENATRRARFVTETLSYLNREGMLADAEEVTYSIDEGQFSDIAYVRSLVKDQPGLVTGRKPTCTVVTVCVTIKGKNVIVKICVTKHF